MKPVYIFRHISYEGPGYLAKALDKNGIPYQTVAIDQGDRVPDSLEDISGLIFMGGSMSVNDSLPWIEEELRLIRLAAERRIPVLGHCLGGQLISKALGGSIRRNPVKEIGWLPVERIENEAARRWLGNLPQRFEAFHWHGETFTIPEGATPILQSIYCHNQAFVLDNILALQCHVEMTPDMVIEWAQKNAHELRHPAKSVQSAEEMTTNLKCRVDKLRSVADTLYGMWLSSLATV